MLNVRIVRGTQFLLADHDGTLELENSRDMLCQLLAADAGNGRYDLLLDVRDADIELRMKEIWTLLQDVNECAPGFDGRVALLDRWDQTFDRMQFFAASAERVGFQARAFIDFENAINWLWESQHLPDADDSVTG